MGISKQKDIRKGSQFQIRKYVNERTGEINAAIADAAGGALKGEIEWRSPLEHLGFAEYYDGDALKQLEIDLEARPLEKFWPRRGPHWDGLATTAEGHKLLVEAKSHISEIFTTPTQASGRSLELIKDSLAETAEAFGAKTSCDWSDTFYQYANRLAHLYLLRKLNGIDAWLVFLGFLDDKKMNGPQQASEWEAAYAVVHQALGIGRSRLLKYVLHVHIPAVPYSSHHADD